MIPFIKTHALGNDFILVERKDGVPSDYPTFARRICDRYFGIGGDGLILWNPDGDVFRIRIFNQDGSEAECSGNGLRCTAAYLIESRRWPNDDIKLETISGVYALRRVGAQYEADMGEPKLAPENVPFLAGTPMKRVVNYLLEADGQVFSITARSTEIPIVHCSSTGRRLTSGDRTATERHSVFPTDERRIHSRFE